MIKVESIEIEQFRGIPKLFLEFKEENFAVCGPNGTGKSGVIDALEFVLTGNISRLSGEGRGEVSVMEHGPHVDMRANPAKAKVKITVKIPSLNKTATIERSVKNLKNPIVTPKDPEIIQVIQIVSDHPEIVLSRRELIRYILVSPGDRAKEVAALLHLDTVEKVRTTLQKISNSCDKELKGLDGVTKLASEKLIRSLEIPTLTKQKMLEAANAHRVNLGLPPLTDIAINGSFKDGLAAPGPAQSQTIPKAQALSDIQDARKAISEITSATTVARITEVSQMLNELIKDSSVVSGLQLETFYTSGLKILLSDECPFCNTPWNINHLKQHLAEKLARLKEISKKRKTVDGNIAPITTILKKARASIVALMNHAVLIKLGLEKAVEAKVFVDSSKVLFDELDNYSSFAVAIESLEKISKLRGKVEDYISELNGIVSVLPDPSSHDASKEFLTVAQVGLEALAAARHNAAKGKDRADKARLILEQYVKTSDLVLEGIYTDVEKDFSNLYRFINQDDEEGFNAKLIPSQGKLGFNVDFYGRGFFPPGAYHSEGHQDSMGLCLYLALMRHLQKERFTFSVLDDVLMSVDVGHRRKVCKLLKKEFPNTQFIMTTHDRVWLRLMRTEKLIAGKSDVHFYGWTVENGPLRWDERDAWTEIKEHLEKNDVRSAAGRLRNYLEFLFDEICQNLRVPVEYRGDAQHNLGDLLPRANSHFRKLILKGRDSAISWGRVEKAKELEEKERAFGSLVATQEAEQWLLNPAIHYNRWENLSKNDFEPVVIAFKELINAFNCTECHKFLWIESDQGSASSLRCDCGQTNINLVKN